MTDPIRAALSQPEPAGLSDEELLQIAAKTINPYEDCGIGIDEYEAETECAVEAYGSELIAFARAVEAATLARAQRQPVPPEQGEVQELVKWLRANSSGIYRPAARAADLLAQRYPQPVPVSEWRTIDTAPKDGTEILASDYDAVEILSWRKGRFELGIPGEWISRDGQAFFPAWWQPLAGHPALPLPVEVEG